MAITKSSFTPKVTTTTTTTTAVAASSVLPHAGVQAKVFSETTKLTLPFIVIEKRPDNENSAWAGCTVIRCTSSDPKDLGDDYATYQISLQKATAHFMRTGLGPDGEPLTKLILADYRFTNFEKEVWGNAAIEMMKKFPAGVNFLNANKDEDIKRTEFETYKEWPQVYAIRAGIFPFIVFTHIKFGNQYGVYYNANIGFLTVKPFASSNLSGLGGWWDDFTEKVEDIASDVWDKIKEYANDAWDVCIAVAEWIDKWVCSWATTELGNLIVSQGIALIGGAAAAICTGGLGFGGGYAIGASAGAATAAALDKYCPVLDAALALYNADGDPATIPDLENTGSGQSTTTTSTKTYKYDSTYYARWNKYTNKWWIYKSRALSGYLGGDDKVGEEVGTEDSPPTQNTNTPIKLYENWWFWAGIGGIVLAGGATGAVIYKRRKKKF